MKNSKLPAPGKMPKAAKGKCGPGMGKSVTADNTRGMNPTASAGGQGHPGLGPGGSHESYKNAPKDFPTLGGNPPTVRPGKW